MRNIYNYFKRDISWLSFNYRVLLEAKDIRLPLYERISFISIYSSNLEEFYKIRVSEHKAIVKGGARNEEESVQASIDILEEITTEVNRQVEERTRIYEEQILPALNKKHILFYQNHKVEEFHEEFIKNFFKEEIFPYLQPVPVCKNKVISFLRDKRIYLATRLLLNGSKKEDPDCTQYFILKLPYTKVPRFIELPKYHNKDYIIYLEDIIKANIGCLFPGYTVDCSYCFKISRDADILIDEMNDSDIVEQVKKKVKKRKIGAVCRFVYERQMPDDFLSFLVDAFHIDRNELVAGDKHLNLEDLQFLPNPNKEKEINIKLQPMKLTCLNSEESIFQYVANKDLLVHYPYHSFGHFMHFLYEAVHDHDTREIMITQYRVAENSAVINTLISAAQNGKRVTVFVELKARFDEENNLTTAEMMKAAGINIIYSIPGLKVHAKVALILRKNSADRLIRSYAYVSTGNFNENTAKVYADSGIFTCNKTIINDLQNLFLTLEKKENTGFRRLLVSQFNMVTKLDELIRHEIRLSTQGKKGRIILKMNALQDPIMINKLYVASMQGVEIDLIIRGICCLIPGQPYSRNIRITRLVDTFLEHARIWYFGNNNDPKIFLGSPDWMRRNLYRRIEAVVPILNADLRQEMTEMLNIQLRDNQKACFVNGHLHNIFKHNPSSQPIRAQYAFYNYLKNKNETHL